MTITHEALAVGGARPHGGDVNHRQDGAAMDKGEHHPRRQSALSTRHRAVAALRAAADPEATRAHIDEIAKALADYSAALAAAEALIAELSRRDDEFLSGPAEQEVRIESHEAALAPVEAPRDLRTCALPALGADLPTAAKQYEVIISMTRGWIGDHAAT